MAKIKEANKKNSHEGHRVRLRERIRLDGVKNLQEYQVLEYLLSFVIARKDANQLGHDLIDAFGNIINVINAPYEDLLSVKGMGDSSATFLSTLKQVIEYIGDRTIRLTPRLTKAEICIKELKPIMEYVGTEKLIILLLDEFDRIIHYLHFHMDMKDCCKVKVQDVQKGVITFKAKKVILAHNHIIGGVVPSESDINITKNLYIAMKLMGVELLDHYILGTNGQFRSMRNSGDMDKILDSVGLID